MNPNRRSFLSGLGSILSMGNSLPISQVTNLVSSGSTLGTYLIPKTLDDDQILHIFSHISKWKSNDYIDITNVDSEKLRKFKAGFSKLLPGEVIPNISCIQDLELWLNEMYVKELSTSTISHKNWLSKLPNNIRKALFPNAGGKIEMLFNEDALVDNAFCFVEGITPTRENSLFSYISPAGKIKKGNIEVAFEYDSRLKTSPWSYYLSDKGAKQTTYKLSCKNPSDLGKVLEMPEGKLKELMDKQDTFEMKEESVKGKDEGNRIKELTPFKRFLLGTTYLTSIKEYTGEKVFDIMKQEKSLIERINSSEV